MMLSVSFSAPIRIAAYEPAEAAVSNTRVGEKVELVRVALEGGVTIAALNQAREVIGLFPKSDSMHDRLLNGASYGAIVRRVVPKRYVELTVTIASSASEGASKQLPTQ